MRGLKQLYFSVYTFHAPISVTCENGRSHETYIYTHFWRISHFQLCESLYVICVRVIPPRNIVFMNFVKFSPKRAHLYIFFRYLRGWDIYAACVATWHFTKMINYIIIFTLFFYVHPKNFLFGRVVCANDVAMN